jgi:ribonuclease HII
LGIRDSKTLTPQKRLRLSDVIKRLAVKHAILNLTPSEIDKVVLKGKRLHKLNWLEAEAMAQIVMTLKPEVVYVDASDVDEARFGRQIKEMVSFQVEIVSEHHADVKYTIVSAASIIAKVHRDQAIALLRERYGDLGSGYSSDPKTIRFLSDWILKKGTLPDFVRKSWKTVKRIMNEIN